MDQKPHVSEKGLNFRDAKEFFRSLVSCRISQGIYCKTIISNVNKSSAKDFRNQQFQSLSYCYNIAPSKGRTIRTILYLF